nr:tyrosine-type recombinase/integrase [Paenibacillus xylanexedens]
MLKFAVKDFMEDRELKNISTYTVDRYTRTLSEFHDFCLKDELINVEQVTNTTIKKYLLHCKNEKGNNATTKNSKLRVLKSFFNYLLESEYIDENLNPARKVNYAREEIKIEVFNDYHIKQMLSYYRKMKDRSKSFYSVRDYTLILFLLSTGCRLGEVSNLRWVDVDLHNQVATVFGKKRELSSIPLVDKIIKELSEFKLYCEKHFKEHVEFVFPNHENSKLTPNAIKCIFKRLQKVMAFRDVRLSAHTFRHTMIHYDDGTVRAIWICCSVRLTIVLFV